MALLTGIEARKMTDYTDMKTIWKFEVRLSMISMRLPSGAKPLAVQLQNNLPHLWALVDPNQPAVMRPIWIIGTGQPVPDAAIECVGTFQFPEAGLTYHVFLGAEDE